ncbi:MAG: DEAD/DEAH box helicase [Bacillota bacterium]
MGFVYNENYFMDLEPNIYGNENLREPQIQGYYHIYDHFIVKGKASHAVIVLPTGVGKTGLMALLPYNISNGRVLIITPQIIIKDTVVDALNPDLPENFWLKRKVFTKPRELPSLVEFEGNKTPKQVLEAANIVILNIQKLQSRLDSSPLNFLPSDFFDMIIIDEAHHSTARTWVETTQYFSTAKVVKVTGTPLRTDKQEIAGELAYKYKLSQAMANEYVKSLENLTYIPEKLLLTVDGDNSRLLTVEEIYDMGIKDEDWVSRSVAYSPECSVKVVDKSIDLLEAKLANNNPVPHKIIAVASSIEHAKQIQALYQERNYPTAIVHSDLSSDLKEKAINDIKNHRVKVVVNVSMLGEGYDHPYLSVAAIFRPFRNPLPYAQFVGRILRTIPIEEALRAEDNIGQIVSHKHLGLENLWEVYKKEIQESEIIKHLKEVDFIEEGDEPTTGEASNTRITDVGKAKEYGTGKLVGDVYLTTELIKRKKEEDSKREQKILEIQKILKVNREEAAKIIDQVNSEESDIKRPDKYFASKKKDIDVTIKENIVPGIISKYNIDQHADNLKNSGLFRNKFSWIAKNLKDNGGMLAVYFIQYLNNEIGTKKEYWTIDDYDIAFAKLPQCVEYVEKVIEDYLNI